PMVAGDGWLATGDHGEVAGGRLEITGRKKDLIITGGENVSPLEVERVLEQHPGVREAGVAGVPDPEWGERVVAYVVGDTTGLAEWARERLPGFKAPKEYRRVKVLPRTPSGKLQRSKL
ncbi:MAG: 2-succinylbenzoate-CoA ligase, partial [Thermoleophilaceae bacterium]|nr:2-succinylbenzoate-CoA ligase [Thermoleophilaceae bacterium]